MKRRIIILLKQALLPVMLSGTLLVNAQDPGILRDVSVLNPIPPTPEMASLGRYGNIDVDYSAGTASYGIPLHTINIDGVALPLQLLYSSNGFKPGDIGSYLGLHWILNGIGGISRSIKGHPDESGYLINSVDQAYINTITTATGYAAQGPLADANKGTDISQDAYTISFPGLSGQFFINAQKEFTYSIKSDNKIEYTLTTGTLENDIVFKITDAKGNQYEFEEQERTWIVSTTGYGRSPVTQNGVTSWKISRIITATGKEIVFNYTEYDYMYSADSHEVFMGKSSNEVPPDGTLNCGCSDVETWQYGSNLYSFKSKLLTSIETDFETVEFTYTTDASAYIYQEKLSQILVKDHKGLLKKKYDLDFGYYAGGVNRLKLTQVKSVNVLNESMPGITHEFTYHENYAVPDVNTKGLDIFKYYNGASNLTLIHSTQPSFSLGGTTDRTVNASYAQLTLLEKITFPTGGSTTMIYEPNGDLGANDMGIGLRIKEVVNRDESSHIATRREFVYRDYESSQGILANNVAPEVFVEYSNPGSIPCARLTLTSDNHWSSVGNTIPLPEEYFYNEVDILEIGGGQELKTSMFFVKIPSMSGDRQVREERIKTFKLVGTTYSLIKEIENQYTVAGISGYSHSVLQFAALPTELKTSIAWPEFSHSWCYDFHTGIAQSLPRFQTRVLLTKVIETSAETSGNLVTEKSYGYLPAYELVRSVTTITSDGKSIRQQWKYPFDMAPTAPYTTMESRNMIASVVEQTVTDVTPFAGKDLSKNKVHYGFENGTSMILPQYIESATLTNSLELDGTIELYDEDGNAIQLKGKDGITKSYFFDLQKRYILAEARNAAANEIFFDSFEDSQGWDIQLSFTEIQKHSGRLAGLLNVPSSSTLSSHATAWLNSNPVADRKFKFSGWIYTSGPQAKIILKMKNAAETGEYTYQETVSSTQTGSWVYLEKVVTLPADVEQLSLKLQAVASGTGGLVYFDDLRLHPADAEMISFTFEPLWGITSTADTRNNFTFYEYDGLGRLIVARDKDKNIIKRFCYNYFGQPENCECVNTNANWQNTVTSVRCKLNEFNQNTGELEQEQKDMNACSPTYNQTRWIVAGTDTETCMVTLPPLDCNDCSGEGYRCINNRCRLGVKVYTSSVYNQSTGMWDCIYHYEWSGSSWSHDYSEQSSSPCIQ